MNKVRRAADAVLLGAGFFCLAFLLLNLTRHGWAWHYILLIVCAAVLFAALHLSVSTKGNVVLLLLSTAVGLYGSEVLLGSVLLSSTRFSVGDWLALPSDRSAHASTAPLKEGQSERAPSDGRTRLQVVEDLRKSGVHAYPDVFSAVLFQPGGTGVIRSIFSSDRGEFLPLASIANVITVFCNESGEFIVYESDEHGFHNTQGMWQARPVQVVALGDSFAHGACVPSGKNFVAGIRSRFPATINLGINGNGPLAALATLKEYATRLRPAIVLWFFYEGNDSRDLDRREENSPLLQKYLDPSFSQHLIDRQDEIDRVLRAHLDQRMQSQDNTPDWEECLKLAHLRRAAMAVFHKTPATEGMSSELIEYIQENAVASTRDDLRLFRTILSDARSTVESWNGRLYFVYLPAWQRYGVPGLAPKDRQAVLMIARELNIPVVDLHAAFAAHPDPLSLFPSRRYAHYNVEGHRLVAGEVLNRLATDGFRLTAHGTVEICPVRSAEVSSSRPGQCRSSARDFE